MEKIRKAWVLAPDCTSCEIGDVSRSEIEKLWGSRWAQKCIRDVSEQVAIDRFSPKPREKNHEFCPPQLGFENEDAVLVISPEVDVKPAILYGAPMQDFDYWRVYLRIRKGSRFLGVLPFDYRFELIVTQEEALELVRLFFDYPAKDLTARTKVWRHEIHERYRHRLVGAFFL